MIGPIHKGVSSTHITFRSLEIEGIGRCSIGTTVNSSESLLLANFEGTSAWEFSLHGIYTNSNFSKVGKNSITCLRYDAMTFVLSREATLHLANY